MKRNKLNVILIFLLAVTACALSSCSEYNQKNPEETTTLSSASVSETIVVTELEPSTTSVIDTTEATETIEEVDPNVFYNDRLSLEFKILNFNIYDDSNILEQSQYAEEYFITGAYPDPDYVYIGIMWTKLREEHPEVDEYLNLDYGEQLDSDFDFNAFINEHSDEYVVEAHPDTRYIFITFEVTNVTDNPLRESLSDWLYIENDSIDDNGRNYVYTEAFSYFDYREDADDPEWVHYASYYTFAPRETRTFTIGYTLYAWPYNDGEIVFTDNDRYYYCKPYIMEGETPPEELSRSVYLNDLPAAEYIESTNGN